MTGFGRAEFAVRDGRFEVEARSVNHRYLDVRVRLPRIFAAFESEVRAALPERIARGKLDLVVSQVAGAAPAPRLRIDEAAAARYVETARELRERYDLAGPLDVASLLALPGVTSLEEAELPTDALREGLFDGVSVSLDALDAMRRREGEVLARELRSRLDRVAELGAALEARTSVVQDAVRERLRKRTEQLRRETGLLDEARLHQEIVIAADRLDVTEELVRLHSHVEQFRSAIAASGADGTPEPTGRRLDFLLQELLREANTIGSKGGDAPVAHLVVELKTELERIREQVQNVE